MKKNTIVLKIGTNIVPENGANYFCYLIVMKQKEGDANKC